jgi:PIN domain nuclease of toxin-antitoxin system
VKLLLDTCTFLWLALQPARLSAEAARALADPANRLYLSAVSAWEVALLYSLGRVSLQQPLNVFVPAERARPGIEELELEEPAALYLPNLPQLHKDPFDRMLVCQASVHNLMIVTPDPLIRQYPVQTLW